MTPWPVTEGLVEDASVAPVVTVTVPFPVTVGCCGPSLESFGKVMVAERAPTAAGVNVMPTVHEPPAGM